MHAFQEASKAAAEETAAAVASADVQQRHALAAVEALRAHEAAEANAEQQRVARGGAFPPGSRCVVR